jgi:hypothetical protein
MARFVLVSIPDNANADAFVKAIEGQSVLFARTAADNEVSWQPLEGAKAEAMFAQPTKFCECTDYTGVSTPTVNYAWYVHSKCAKPRKGRMQHPRDLLRPIGTRKDEAPFYLGFRAGKDSWGYDKSEA